MKNHPWSDLVQRYSDFEMKFEGNLPSPATEDQLHSMIDGLERDSLVIDETYIDFLRTRNGTSFNGLMLYGAGISDNDPYRRLDLVLMNRFHWDRCEATVLGTSDVDIYVITRPGGPFCRLDRPSWDVIDEFSSCDDLLVSIFTQELARLDDVG